MKRVFNTVSERSFPKPRCHDEMAIAVVAMARVRRGFGKPRSNVIRFAGRVMSSAQRGIIIAARAT